MNNLLIYFFTVIHAFYALISFLIQRKLHGQLFQSLAYTLIFLTPLFLAPLWLNPTLHLHPCSKYSSPILMLSLQASFKHPFSFLLLLWAPYLVTIYLLFMCSALTHPSFTSLSSTPLLRFFPLPSFLTSLLTSVCSLSLLYSPTSFPKPSKKHRRIAWYKETSNAYSI